MSTEVELQAICKSFGSCVTADHVSLEFAAGTTTAIAGISGAGKSTLLRMICGLEQPDSGTVLLDGNSTRRVTPAKRGIAYLSQEAALYPRHSLLKNITLSLSSLRLKKEDRQARTREAIESLGLSGLENRTPAQLSGGQRQRAALAKALARRSQVLLLDEPFSQLDVANRAVLRSYIASIQALYCPTIILVSHDPLDAQILADRLIVFHNGTVAQAAPPIEIHTSPKLLVALKLTSPVGINHSNAAGWEGIERKQGALVFRPHAIAINPPEDSNHRITNTGSVQRLINLGSETLIRLNCNGETLAGVVANSQAEMLQMDEQVRLVVKKSEAWRLDNDESGNLTRLDGRSQ